MRGRDEKGRGRVNRGRIEGGSRGATEMREGESKQKTETFAYIKQDDGQFVKQMIEIGVSDLNYAEIKKGLNLGDEIALEKPDDNKILEEIITLEGEKVEAPSPQETDPMIAKYDKNGDGKLSREERMEAFKNMSDEERRAAIQKFMQSRGSGSGGRGPSPGGRKPKSN